MRSVVGLLVVVLVCCATVSAVQYTWDQDECEDNRWNGQTSPKCWNPDGTPGADDDVIIPPFADVIVDNTTGDNYQTFPYVYSPTGYIPINSLVVSKGGSLTITDMVAVYIAQDSIVLGTLTLQAYIGAIDGPGDLTIIGTLNFNAGNIQGTGELVIESPGQFLINNYNQREVYLMRNTTIYGNATTATNNRVAIHVGFWWQPGNVSIVVGSGGVLTTGSFFSKHFEGLTNINSSRPNIADFSGSILVEYGGTWYLGYQKFFVWTVVNYGHLYMVSQCLSYTVSCYYWPYGNQLSNFGNITYYNPPLVSADGEEVSSYMALQKEDNHAVPVRNCDELYDYIISKEKRDIDIYVEAFNYVGPMLCDINLPLVVEDAKISFKGTGGLIFGLSIILTKADLIIEDSVDVVFIKQFHAKDSLLEVPINSIVKLMFMPEDSDGYHNYLDKNVMLWPDDEKKISFSEVTMVGGGSVEFLSELNLKGDLGFTIESGDVFFQREFGASAISGEGDLIILENGFASFGIDSVLTGEGKIHILGEAEISEIAKVVSERDVTVEKGAKLTVEGGWKVIGKFTQL